MLALALYLSCLPVVAQTQVTVEIKGISTELETNVRLLLSIEQQKNHPLITTGRLQRLHQKALQEISSALQPFGYYRPKIESSLIKSNSGIWQASYIIAAGPPLPISEFNFLISSEMSEDPEFVKLLKNNRLQTGSSFNHLKYEEFKADLAKLSIELGYFNAKFTEHRVEIDLDSYTARVY